jgi:hypothetical protein
MIVTAGWAQRLSLASDSIRSLADSCLGQNSAGRQRLHPPLACLTSALRAVVMLRKALPPAAAMAPAAAAAAAAALGSAGTLLQAAVQMDSGS